MVDCGPPPDPRLELKIARTQAELEACFALVHDAYVADGFMPAHPSGLRVTPYHALPTTTLLCATFDGQVVGTLSIVREGVFGFPMQSAFDLSSVRARGGRIAEISALAVHPAFRRGGGRVLFPLLKFMYECCAHDTRHLVIAVHPSRAELCEALLMFDRLPTPAVDHYGFAGGAPAIGMALDLQQAAQQYQDLYGGRSDRRNLHRYFVEGRLPQIPGPARRPFASDEPVLTPALLDHFFKQRTAELATLDARRLRLLHSVYRGDAWASVLPPLPHASVALRREPRFSVNCAANLSHAVGRTRNQQRATLIDLSMNGFQARSIRPLAVDTRCIVEVTLADGQQSRIDAVLVRNSPSAIGHFHGFRIEASDEAWRRHVQALQGSPVDAEARPDDVRSAPGQRTRPAALEPV